LIFPDLQDYVEPVGFLDYGIKMRRGT